MFMPRMYNHSRSEFSTSFAEAYKPSAYFLSPTHSLMRSSPVKDQEEQPEEEERREEEEAKPIVEKPSRKLSKYQYRLQKRQANITTNTDSQAKEKLADFLEEEEKERREKEDRAKLKEQRKKLKNLKRKGGLCPAPVRSAFELFDEDQQAKASEKVAQETVKEELDQSVVELLTSLHLANKTSTLAHCSFNASAAIQWLQTRPFSIFQLASSSQIFNACRLRSDVLALLLFTRVGVKSHLVAICCSFNFFSWRKRRLKSSLWGISKLARRRGQS